MTPPGPAVRTTAAPGTLRSNSLTTGDWRRRMSSAVKVVVLTPSWLAGVAVRVAVTSYNMVLVDGIPVNEPGGTFNFVFRA